MYGRTCQRWDYMWRRSCRKRSKRLPISANQVEYLQCYPHLCWHCAQCYSQKMQLIYLPCSTPYNYTHDSQATLSAQRCTTPIQVSYHSRRLFLLPKSCANLSWSMSHWSWLGPQVPQMANRQWSIWFRLHYLAELGTSQASRCHL